MECPPVDFFNYRCTGLPFADTFDDVISTAVATGALGNGTAGSALRGGVVA